ncbi:GntR family transcriptional regulator [Frankia sp. CNm7]|uniref:GntR family transcriptional regulator n=1 Tax=Frankia nepalensis TaxID=1836974 RepID=A0A937RKA9_9ACTN|nr:GntR family transcriptional regulator [Frankia nepalensis]MBL7494786.1 GntR family transcriptional regulator [Frankia nepalensis]MBL7514340.1 GntR family transcriptional regulator [Frankia nepalensis]MBL7517243.1 GntR family transcriptional regulator [Frankia nepalensis]MBL7631732.1 GntR family transcriptional regulator [Frankia nepalensis]
MTPTQPPTARPSSAQSPAPARGERRGSPTKPLTAGNLRDHAYVGLRQRLMAGEFSFRDRLTEERLAALLGVSRTPVREALARLASDGLVEKRSDGGYYPAEPDLVGLRDLYEIRVVLELRGLERALESGVPHDVALLEPLRDSWRALRAAPPAPDPSFVGLDEGFHLTLSRASGNVELANMLGAVNARIRPVRMHDFLTADRIHLTIEQHLDIVETVLAGDLPEAVRKLRSHVGESMEVVEKRAARAITQMVLRRGRSPRQGP